MYNYFSTYDMVSLYLAQYIAVIFSMVKPSNTHCFKVSYSTEPMCTKIRMLILMNGKVRINCQNMFTLTH